MIDPTLLSDGFSVRRLNETDMDDIFSLCAENTTYYAHLRKTPSRELISDDMTALPRGKSPADKYFLGFYDGGTLIAVMDLIDGYPDDTTAYIGFFMMRKDRQYRGIGTGIVAEVCDKLASFGFAQIKLAYVDTNKQAKCFWEKCGFIPDGKRGDNDGVPITELCKRI